MPLGLVSPEVSSWLTDGHLLTVSSQSLSLCSTLSVSPPALIKGSFLLKQAPVLMSLLNLNYLLKGLTSRYSHTGGVRASTYEWQWGTIQSMAGAVMRNSDMKWSRKDPGLQR